MLTRADAEALARDTVCELALTGAPCDPALFCGASAVSCGPSTSCDADGHCVP
ncbi:MAG: hypothetical protein ABMB14_15000 [Myxococcota bacterium]